MIQNKRPVQLGPYENEQQVNELKKTLMDNGFKISQGAIGYDSTTRKAEQRYNLLKKHDYTHAQILYVARQEQAPYHLLLDGNKELFDKWFEPTSLTDEEYGQVYPDAPTNAEVLRQKAQSAKDIIFNHLLKLK